MATKKATKKQAIKLKDLPAKEGKDVKGGKAVAVRDCDEFGCGGNHNETLLSD
jgi:hypothetical protein